MLRSQLRTAIVWTPNQLELVNQQALGWQIELKMDSNFGCIFKSGDLLMGGVHNPNGLLGLESGNQCRGFLLLDGK